MVGLNRTASILSDRVLNGNADESSELDDPFENYVTENEQISLEDQNDEKQAKNQDDTCMIWWEIEGQSKNISNKLANDNLPRKPAAHHAFVFLPEDRIKTFWDVLIASVLSISVFVLPFRIAFLDWRTPSDIQDCRGIDDANKCTFNMCSWDDVASACGMPQIWFVLLYTDATVDFLFLADVLVSFRSAYFIERNSERVLVTDAKKIAIHYLKTWFFVDLSASIPIEFVNFLMQSGQNSAIGRALNSTKLIRLVNLAKMLRLLKIWRIKELWAGYISNTLFDLVGFMFAFVIIGHTMACFMFWVGTFKDFTCDKVTPLCTPDDVVQGNVITWVTRSYILTRDAGEQSVEELRIDYQYLISLYWAFTTMTTVGYGDLKPKTIYEVWALIVCMLIGATTFSLLVGTVSHSIDRMQGSNFWERTYSMLSFMHGHRLPRDLRRRIRDFLGHERAAASHGMNRTLFQDLSPIIQRGILMNMHYETISSSPLLRRLLCSGEAIDLLGSLAIRLTTEMCNPGDILFCAGDAAQELILVESGTFILIDAETSSHFATFRAGSDFGENCLLDGQDIHVFSAVAESWGVIHRLRRCDVEEVLEDHPALLHSLRLLAQLRWIRLKQAVEAHRALRCARNRRPGLTSQTLLRVLAALGEGSGAAAARKAFSPEERGLQQQLRASAVPAELWRALANKLADAPRGVGGDADALEWDWSADWVDDVELPTIAAWFERSCSGAALGAKVAAGLAMEAPPTADLPGTSIAGLETGGSLGYAGPVRDLEQLLALVLRRLDVVEAQVHLLPQLEQEVLTLQENLRVEEDAEAHY